MLDELAPAYQQLGLVRERMGADTVNVVPHSHYECADGTWIAMACSHDGMFVRIAEAMGRPELAADDRWGRKAARLAERDEVNRVVGDWVRTLRRDSCSSSAATNELPIGPVYSIADIFTDPQYAHRGTIQEVASRLGPLAVPGVFPDLSDTPGEIRWLGPELGSTPTRCCVEVLGRTDEEIAGLRDDGVRVIDASA